LSAAEMVALVSGQGGRQHQLVGWHRVPAPPPAPCGPIHLGCTAAPRSPVPGEAGKYWGGGAENRVVHISSLGSRICSVLRSILPGPSPPTPSPLPPRGWYAPGPPGQAAVDVARTHAEEGKDAGRLLLPKRLPLHQGFLPGETAP
jgi:hypothetical protein